MNAKMIEEMEQFLVQKIVLSKSWKPKDIIEHLSKMFIPEGSVVLTSEQYSNYLILQTNEEWLKNKAAELQTDNERLYKNLGKFKESVRKETAKEIFKWLKEHHCGEGWIIVETYFKEQFGVEVEE